MAGWDVVVLGAGPAALAAARAAAEAGVRTALVPALEPDERRVRADEGYAEVARAALMAAVRDGRPPQGVGVLGDLLRASREEARRAGERAREEAVAAGAELLDGRAVVLRRRRGRVLLEWTPALPDPGGLGEDEPTLPRGPAAGDGEPRVLAAASVVLAPGVRPAAVPALGVLDGDPAVVPAVALHRTAVPPSSAAVLGGGAVACETAQALARVGAPVALVCEGPLLPDLHPEDAAAVAAALEADGVELHVGARVTTVDRAGGGLLVDLTDGGHLVVAALVPEGVRPRTRGLGLEQAGVRLDRRGRVRVGEDLRVTARRLRRRVRGAGAAVSVDGADPVQRLADAVEQGRLAGLAAAGRGDAAWRPHAVPSAVATDPPAALVGCPLPAARARGPDVREELSPAVGEGVVRLVTGPWLGGLGSVPGRRRLLGMSGRGDDAVRLLRESAEALGGVVQD